MSRTIRKIFPTRRHEFADKHLMRTAHLLHVNDEIDWKDSYNQWCFEKVHHFVYRNGSVETRIRATADRILKRADIHSRRRRETRELNSMICEWYNENQI